MGAIAMDGMLVAISAMGAITAVGTLLVAAAAGAFGAAAAVGSPVEVANVCPAEIFGFETTNAVENVETPTRRNACQYNAVRERRSRQNEETLKHENADHSEVDTNQIKC